MRILLVEDDELVAEALVKDLTNQNYAVDVAADGQAGIRRCFRDTGLFVRPHLPDDHALHLDAAAAVADRFECGVGRYGYRQNRDRLWSRIDPGR